jgi:hypothetical protein
VAVVFAVAARHNKVWRGVCLVGKSGSKVADGAHALGSLVRVGVPPPHLSRKLSAIPFRVLSSKKLQLLLGSPRQRDGGGPLRIDSPRS